MTAKQTLFSKIVEEAIVAVVREESAEAAYNVARAYARGGLRNIEITLTTPDALQIIGTLAAELAPRGVVIAAGTVRSAEDAAQARKAGAQIIVSPHTDMRVIEYATEHDLLCVAGAATTTEIINAWNVGADLIKVYPAGLFGGPAYIRTIRQPIRDVPMLAGGPVLIDQIVPYLDAGAVAVNLGGSLADPLLVRDSKWDEIADRAATAASIVAAHKGRPVEATVH
jgi:2-dehydro-3-deoxyphosphogluconate aldolase / (4S)-4-hydroxy-2-oxoglutarate aldolase